MIEVVRHRPAVRIVCLDSSYRVLLLRWRDPFDGAPLWEPPGGGIGPGETPYQAACRELVEETGLSPSAIGTVSLDVHRDTMWNGIRYVGAEQFFLARYDSAAPAVGRDGLMADEQVNLDVHGWWSRDELARLDARLEPPGLASVIAMLDSGGPWV